MNQQINQTIQQQQELMQEARELRQQGQHTQATMIEEKAQELTQVLIVLVSNS